MRSTGVDLNVRGGGGGREGRQPISSATMSPVEWPCISTSGSHPWRETQCLCDECLQALTSALKDTRSPNASLFLLFPTSMWKRNAKIGYINCNEGSSTSSTMVPCVAFIMYPKQHTTLVHQTTCSTPSCFWMGIYRDWIPMAQEAGKTGHVLSLIHISEPTRR